MTDLIMDFPVYIRAIILIYMILMITCSGVLFSFHMVKHAKITFVVCMFHLLILCYLCITVG
jgi:hypothetical protein